MLARQLSSILFDLCRGRDIVTATLSHMDQRVESLRGFNHLPRGRENRGCQLTDKQIFTVVLGLVAMQPSWAGHVAMVIVKLRSVGGKTDTLGGVETLTDALSNVLTDKFIRDSIIAIRISMAELGSNSYGFAAITYDCGGTRHQLSFVRDEVVSLIQPGAAVQFDVEQRNSLVSRELVFNRRFFEQLPREVEVTRAYPSLPIGDGSEYDKEDAECERHTRLGAPPSSRFLNIGFDNQVAWPSKETLVEFDRYKFVLMPKTKEHVQSIHVDLHANRLSIKEAMTAINHFLSLLTWCDDQYAIAQDGWSGSPVQVAVPKRNPAFTTTSQWVFNLDIPTSDEVRRALALYRREARNAEQNFMISYAVLSYFNLSSG